MRWPFRRRQSRSLAQAFSEAGWRQLHVAETEKYAHVTYFFNGGVERPYPGEDRELIPSLKVATYDLAPEMRAEAITDALVAAIVSGDYDFIVANFANPDMVAHTGRWEATIAALEVLDGCLGRIVRAIEAVDADAADADDSPGALLAITADHGNADELRDAAGNPVTAHSLNPVPFVLVGRAVRGRGAGGRCPGRRRADPARAGRAATLGRHDRRIAHPVIASVAVRSEDPHP